MEQIQELRLKIGDKLEKVDFDTRRFVLEVLETQIIVGLDGAMRLTFAIPELDTNVVSYTSGEPSPFLPTLPLWEP